MSSREAKEQKPLRHAWSLHLDYDDFYLDEPISGHLELLVQDVYMARTIELNLMQYITVAVSDKYVCFRDVEVSCPVLLLLGYF